MTDVRVQSPTGEYGTVPQDQAAEAMAKGYRPVDDQEWEKQEEKKSYGGFVQGRIAEAIGGVRGMAAGYGIPLDAAVKYGLQANMGAQALKAATGVDLSEKASTELQNYKEYRPFESGFGEVGGNIGAAIIGGEGGAVAGAEKAGGRIASALGAGGSRAIPLMVRKAVQGGLGGAVIGAVNEVNEQSLKDGAWSPADILAASGKGLGFGLAGGAAGAGIAKLAGGAANALIRTSSHIGEVFEGRGAAISRLASGGEVVPPRTVEAIVDTSPDVPVYEDVTLPGYRKGIDREAAETGAHVKAAARMLGNVMGYKLGVGGYVGRHAADAAGDYILANHPKVVADVADTVAAWGSAAKVSKSVTEQVSAAVTDYLSGRPTKALSNALSSLPFDSEDSGQVKGFVDRVQGLEQDPEAKAKYIEQETAGLNKVPALKAAIAARMASNISLVAHPVRVPKGLPQVGPWALLNDPKYNTSEVEDYSQYVATVMDPRVALSAMHQGRLTPNHVAALHDAHPEYLQKIVSAVTNYAGDNQEPPDYDRMGQLTVLLGQPMDASWDPKVADTVQQMFLANANKRQEGSQGGGSSAKPGNMSKRYMSASERLEDDQK